MTSANLERLAAARQLKAEPPSRKELEGLVRLGRARLEGARKPDLALEARFDLGYGAAHALSLAALRWHGYRSENRYLVFQCLQHTLGLGAEHWRVLALCHERRNAAEYGGDFQVDEKLMAELLKVTDAVLAKVSKLKLPPDFVAMACTTASVSYREALRPEELVQSLLTGKVPKNRHAHFHVLLDEAPVPLLKGLLEQVGRQATYEQVAKNFERIANDLTSSRDLRALLFDRPK